MLPWAFFEVGCACEVTLALKLVSLARNRLNFGRYTASFGITESRYRQYLMIRYTKSTVLLTFLLFLFVIKTELVPVQASGFCDTVTQIPETECLALLSLYNSTNGDSWYYNGNWFVTNTPCNNWYAVDCGNGHITELRLDYNGVSGTLPVELGDLVHLKNLTLGGNQISGILPPELGNLSQLEYLRLGANKLNGGIPSELGQLTNLLWLDLSQNELTGNIPSELGDLSNLEILTLENNELSGSLPLELSNLVNLKYLYFRNNQLTGILPESFINFTQLEVFFFENTKLCESATVAFQSWLSNINLVKSTGAICTQGLITLSETTFTSDLDNTTYTFVANTFTNTTVITHAILSKHTPPTYPKISIGHIYEVTAIYSGSQTLAQPDKAYTLTIQYSEEEKGAAIENSLSLYFWDGDSWEEESSSVLDIENKVITATPTHFSIWAVLGETKRLYLPLIFKGYFKKQ